MEKWGSFDILHDTNEDVTLVQLMESIGNFNCVVCIVGYWVFYSNYKNEIPLTLDSLKLLCSHLEWEGMFDVF